jgi:hypothetical protein
MMDFNKIKPIEIGIVGIAIFLLAWGMVEQLTGTEPKGAPAGATHQAAAKVGATVTPSEPSMLQ